MWYGFSTLTDVLAGSCDGVGLMASVLYTGSAGNSQMTAESNSLPGSG